MYFLLKIQRSKYTFKYIWSPSSRSELTPMIFNMELTHLGSEASIYYVLVFNDP